VGIGASTKKKKKDEVREGIKRTNGNCGEWASTKSRR
jgi:hypothetical protein